MAKNKSLKDISTKAPKSANEQKMREENLKLAEQITEMQVKMFAGSKRSMLIILQGMDASGKDGVIKHIFT
jgi:polyphosphate kinase 2 (PPK2 family)